ncbi:dihydrolipoyl dehydrogenase [Rhodoferax sp. AJA081-3]|uniref:dihydrolipoyl dehydrogenase n=1 Tax=Rhodoferax sp. AJA081-3 TaxID=2752316 RepID=UPI001AE08F53|nr:dihydrolipoyl dehydrogenase [Rhodoferax sp. AJA081-3]QTN27855.1 dihydrolipoyl dehydrogenase [Rhodoferax sp. AJA081-3]
MNPNTVINTDVAIIGAGTAGMSAYRAALEQTSRVLLIESGLYGTTCARVGCMPSKLLIAAADAAHAVVGASRFGVTAGLPTIDGRAVMARVRSERDRFVGFVVDTVQNWPTEQRLVGHARFVDDHTLQVGATRVKAQRIVIATGSRPAVPQAWRLALGDRLIVNDDVFNWTDLPRSVAVVGPGVIGLELAQALHRLGVRVRLYGRSGRVGPLTDPQLQALAHHVFAADLPLSVDLAHIEPRREGDSVVVRATNRDGNVHEEHFDWLLATTGRRPNVDQLGSKTQPLPMDPNGIPVHDRRSAQVANRPVFIAGDVSQDRPLLHEAADEGRIAGGNAGRFPDVRVRPRRAPLAVVFSDPQIALAGASHSELMAAGIAFETGRVSFDDQGRSRVMGRNQGALHVYGEAATGRFLGAEMLGPAAEHIGHLLAWSVQRGDTVQQMLDSPFYHPVVEEGLRTALRQLQRALHIGPPPVERCLDCGPGA